MVVTIYILTSVKFVRIQLTGSVIGHLNIETAVDTWWFDAKFKN